MAAEPTAGAFLSSFFQFTFERLASRDFLRGSKHGGVLKKLEITVNSINQVLDDAEKKQYQNPRVKMWLDELKHVAYETDQLLDEIATDATLKKLKAKSHPATSKVRGFFSAFTSNPFESRIKELLENFEFLAKQKETLGLREVTFASNEGDFRGNLSKRLPTTSLLDLSNSIDGRDGEKEQVINFLLSDHVSGNQVPVISILGIGGMGKTTLAQLVYNDQRLQEQFELKAWVYVSEHFDAFGVTKAILKSFQLSANAEDLNSLQLELQNKLMGKKYFLVLDDVWNEDWASWEVLKVPLNYGSSGSRILTTTCDKKVATVLKSTHLLPLKELGENDCWSLFVRHAFQDKDVNEYPNLESIGRKIVQKCGGLPLAVKALGNLLQIRFSKREWVKILETDMWHFSVDNDINLALRLSYHILPSNLKRCFAYCSMFPKGYEFEKDELIKIWIAEGLLKCCGRDKSEEELGDEFFNHLVSISFFQQSGDIYEMGYFVMHDLEGDRVQDIPEKTLHIWWFSDETKDGDKILEHIHKCKGLRSLLMMARIWKGGDQGFKICNNVQHVMFSTLIYLRVLSFRDCYISELADEISNLKLLRYLELSFTDIRRLPALICMLHNLQTLKLDRCGYLTELPSDFYKLVNLHHLHLEATPIEKMPKHIGRLIHLQTLTKFVVGEHSGSDIKELAKLNHLQGKLEISGLGNVTDAADAAEANLKDKKHLEELLLTFHDKSRSTSGENDESIIERCVLVLEALQPDSNLNTLTIYNYRDTSFPDWLGDRHLSNLVSMKLVGCRFCSCLPPLGQLPSLKKLFISEFDEIEIIGREFYGDNSSNVPFRSLTILQFENMYRWKEWFCLEDGEGFPFLKELSMTNCPKLKKALPLHLPSLQKLDISYCQELEASLPKAPNIGKLELWTCGTRVVESSLEQILLNNTFFEVLEFRETLESSALYLSYIPLPTLRFTRAYFSSSWPFSLDMFTNLHSLKLDNCPQLESFPKGGLPSSLSSLDIRSCPKLIASREELGLSKLHSLKELIVSDDFENVESFPEENLLPPNINLLRLVNCSKLRIINYRGFFHLKSLKFLSIGKCPCVEYLPEEGLPNSLSTLWILRCPILKERYGKEEGEHWHKIRHIPRVEFRYC
ncbi:putative disease resistance RPP13-like protein 1 [Gastrolobium bilobum]|uniref:putative disease resistance RPP13-like protein 1 n=1 Tax=Gastrolobium bilobum TaxID=150636 RepID=UPI002AB1DCA3|nr:putative disease resistance RPP13-like protein 1 [Gastrolobium bilobum]